MSYIVQTAVAINTSGGASVTAVFPNPVTAGNKIIVAVTAIDHGSEGGLTSTGQSSISSASIADTLDSDFVCLTSTFGPWAWGNAVGYASALFAGQYVASGVGGGSDSITFTFTPFSASANCHVGIAIYEVFDFGTFTLAQDNTAPSFSIPVAPTITWSGTPLALAHC
jgi:hypothetical protein